MYFFFLQSFEARRLVLYLAQGQPACLTVKGMLPSAYTDGIRPPSSSVASVLEKMVTRNRTRKAITLILFMVEESM